MVIVQKLQCVSRGEQAGLTGVGAAAGGGRWPDRERPALPPVARDDWGRNPIDDFVLARLEREGLGPSPEPDRTTLIRRVSLDLTGLPPTMAEVDAFLSDDSPDAFETVVDRLLESPRYGERMAVEWLDAAAGIPIGVFPDFEWEGAECRFDKDDVLVLYTDGVLEAASESGEHFGAERLEATVRAAPSAPEEMLRAIHEALAAHERGSPPRDDRTLVIVRRCAV